MASVSITVLARNTTGHTFDDLKAHMEELRASAFSASTGMALFGTSLVPMIAAAASAAITVGAAGVAVGAFGLAVLPQIKNITNLSAAQSTYNAAVAAHAAPSAQMAKAEASLNAAVAAHGAGSKQAQSAQTAYNAALAAHKAPSQAMLTDQAALNAQLKDTPSMTIAAATAFTQLKSSFQAWSNSLASSTMPIFTEGMNILRGLLPDLTPLVHAAATEFQGLMDKINTGVHTDKFQELVKEFSSFATGALKSVIDGITSLATHLATGFQSKTFQDFLSMGAKSGPGLVKLFQDLATFIGRFVAAAGPMGGIQLNVLEAMASALNKIPMSVMKVLAPTILGIAAAVKIWTIAQALFNVVMDADPIVLVGVALVALGSYLVYAWNTSLKFREVVTEVFVGISDIVLTVIHGILVGLAGFANGVLQAAYDVVSALAKIPGPTQSSMKSAAADIKGFQGDVATFFGGATKTVDGWKATVDEMPKKIALEGNISDLNNKIAQAKASLKTVPASHRTAVEADISQLLRERAAAQASIDSLEGKTVTVTEKFVATGSPGRAITSFAHGGITSTAATGGIRGGDVLVGENGPERVHLPTGSTVYSNAQTLAMAGQGGGSQRVVLEINSSGAPMDEMLAQMIKKYVRIRGGDVQIAFGR
jgi:hypothetical protein